MPRYFFHVRDGRQYPDEVGTVLADDKAARAAALEASAGMLRDLDEQFWNSGEWLMNVVDDDGREVVRLRFSGTIKGPTSE